MSPNIIRKIIAIKEKSTEQDAATLAPFFKYSKFLTPQALPALIVDASANPKWIINITDAS